MHALTESFIANSGLRGGQYQAPKYPGPAPHHLLFAASRINGYIYIMTPSSSRLTSHGVIFPFISSDTRISSTRRELLLGLTSRGIPKRLADSLLPKDPPSSRLAVKDG